MPAHCSSTAHRSSRLSVKQLDARAARPPCTCPWTPNRWGTSQPCRGTAANTTDENGSLQQQRNSSNNRLCPAQSERGHPGGVGQQRTATHADDGRVAWQTRAPQQLVRIPGRSASYSSRQMAHSELAMASIRCSCCSRSTGSNTAHCCSSWCSCDCSLGFDAKSAWRRRQAWRCQRTREMEAVASAHGGGRRRTHAGWAGANLLPGIER